jgi:hypothetical protein
MIILLTRKVTNDDRFCLSLRYAYAYAGTQARRRSEFNSKQRPNATGGAVCSISGGLRLSGGGGYIAMVPIFRHASAPFQAEGGGYPSTHQLFLLQPVYPPAPIFRHACGMLCSAHMRSVMCSMGPGLSNIFLNKRKNTESNHSVTLCWLHTQHHTAKH